MKQLFLAFCSMFSVCLLVQGQSQYVVEIEFFGYSNPTGRCHECPTLNSTGTHSCCDSFIRSSCNGADLCDSYFYFCLRTIGDSRTTNGCWYPGGNVTFAVVDDARFDINNISAVLGIDNPLILPGLTMDFEGVQLYIEIFDADLSPATAPDEIVDIILIDLSHETIGETPQRRTYSGVFSFVTMDIAVGVQCAGNFQEPDCMQCDLGFTGASCEININECAGVNCSGNGVCVDGINSFSCDCDAGFRGTLCAEAEGLLPSNLLAPVIGGAIGGLILVISVIAAIAVVIVTLAKRGGGSNKNQRQVAN